MNDLKSDSNETSSLLERLDQGAGVFDELFARHRPALRQAVEMRLDAKLRSRVDASDIVQDAQMEAFRRLGDFMRRRPMPFRLWLRKIAQERLIMARRRHLDAARRAVQRELPLPDGSSIVLGKDLLARGGTPSQLINSDEIASRVRQAISQLSDDDREILMMRTFENLTHDEISCVLGIEPATARKRHGRALVRLHMMLTRLGISESQI